MFAGKGTEAAENATGGLGQRRPMTRLHRREMPINEPDGQLSDLDIAESREDLFGHAVLVQLDRVGAHIRGSDLLKPAFGEGRDLGLRGDGCAARQV